MCFEYKMVIVTRKDLKLSPGKLAAQVAHAAVECAFGTKKNNSKWFKKWNQEGAKKVVAKTDSEKDFFVLREKAKDLGVFTKIIADAGHTEISAGTKTVIGFGPAPTNIIDQITGELDLF